MINNSWAKGLRNFYLLLGIHLLLVNSQAITYEQWAIAEFGSANHPDSGPGLDPDSDGLANLREYAAELDPQVSNVVPEVGGMLQHSDGETYLHLQFLRRTDTEDLIYEIRSAAHPSALMAGTSVVCRFEPDGSASFSAGLVSEASGVATVIDYLHPVVDGAERRFMGLSLTLLGGSEIEFVLVGSPGNPASTQSYGQVGQVNSTFQISKHEITNAQYVTFLNAVAASDVPAAGAHSLYNSSMGNPTVVRGGIDRSGSDGSYTYSTRSNMADKPVNYVSIWDAFRYCNWLHNGQPAGAIGPSTTEDGAYDLTDSAAIAANTVVREAGALYWLPDDDEWVKAAYYDPSKAGGYWKYPTSSDVAPTIATAGGVGQITNSGSNVANYNSGAVWNGVTGNLTTVGSAGPGSTSFIGAADMGGNVDELTETIVGPTLRYIRGGSWLFPVAAGLSIQVRTPSNVDVDERSSLGFRIAKAVAP